MPVIRMRRNVAFLLLTVGILFVAGCGESPSGPDAFSTSFGVGGGGGPDCIAGYSGCRLMDDDEQYLFWAMKQDVGSQNAHCARLRNALDDLYRDHPDKVRVYTVATDSTAKGFVDPVTNTLYLREDQFNWSDIYQILPHEGDHYGNHHVHENAIGWVRGIQGWADAVPKTSFHFTSEVQSECIAY